MRTLLQDLRFGLRMLAKNPGFTAVAVITLALGIGANTAIFSVVNAVLMRPLPYSDPERLVWITEILPGANNHLVPSPDYLAWRDQNQIFQSMAAYGGSATLNLSDTAEPERIEGVGVTWNLLPILGVHPALGRGFLPEEDRPAGPPVAILSHGLWQRRFRSDPSLVGKTIRFDEKSFTIVGIMPESFRFPADRSPEIFVPLNLPPKSDWNAPSFRIVDVIARLKPDVTLGRAKSDLATIKNRTEQEMSPGMAREHATAQIQIETLHEHLAENSRPLLLILLAAVGFVLLLVCANVANLQLARAATRQREFAVRAALGANRWRLGRQLLVESSVLATLGGTGGLIVGYGGVVLLRQLGPPNILSIQTISMTASVFAFIAAITLFAGMVFGLAPLSVAFRVDLEETLKETRLTTTAGGRPQRLRALLMVSEFAMAFVLLTGAGLLISTFVHLSSVKPGFDPRQLLTERVMLPLGIYRSPDQWSPFFQGVMERVAGLPGVESVAAASSPPLMDAMVGGVTLEDRPMPASALLSVVSPSYFQTLRIQRVSGRDFAVTDTESSPRVAIVNEIFARRYFGQMDPLGHRFRIVGDSWYSIVGVVGSTRHLPLTGEPTPEVFTCYLQQPFWDMTLIIRSASDPESLAGAVQNKVREVDPNQPVFDIATMEQRFSRAVAPQRFNALVMAIFAVIAVILAAVGIYGVMAYSVAQRTHEIGIRRALGARQWDVIRDVMRRGAWLAVVGITIGLGGAMALTRFLSNLLYGVTIRDPLTLVSVYLILTVVALMASYIPAFRAAKVDPVASLRHE